MRSLGLTLNQEADEIAYRCAFACQTTKYKVTNLVSKRSIITKLNKTKIKKVMTAKDKEINKHYTLERIIEPDPEAAVRHTLKSMLKALYFENEKYKVKKVKLFLSPPREGNFRHHIVKTAGPNGLGYKAGRPERPHHIEYIRSLLLKLGAEVVEGFEADDALGFYQTDTTVASHIDKDINMIPGLHYNHVTRELYEVPEGIGKLWLNDKRKLKGLGLISFYAQMLTGDRTDNIPGISGCGDVGAYKLLSDIKLEDDAWQIVYDRYKTQYDKKVNSILAEIADLLWICRTPNQTGRQYLHSRGYL
jgi:hypothetical protein